MTDRLLTTMIVTLELSSRLAAVETIDRLKARLSQLAIIVNDGVVEGWANIGARTRRRLDEWIAR
jgi:hypothetical protein